MDSVWIVLRNSIDWSGPPPTFRSAHRTEDDAIASLDLTREQWERDPEIRAYYTIKEVELI